MIPQVLGAGHTPTIAWPWNPIGYYNLQPDFKLVLEPRNLWNLTKGEEGELLETSYTTKQTVVTTKKNNYTNIYEYTNV